VPSQERDLEQRRLGEPAVVFSQVGPDEQDVELAEVVCDVDALRLAFEHLFVLDVVPDADPGQGAFAPGAHAPLADVMATGHDACGDADGSVHDGAAAHVQPILSCLQVVHR
jgi:hypothetical protein